MKIKSVQIMVTLGSGSFGTGGNTKTFEGFAVSASVTKPGLPEKNKAVVKISGLSMDDMTKITTLAFSPQKIKDNILIIKAGNLGESLSIVFQGEITTAFADFNTAPEITMNIEAQTGAYASLIPLNQEAVRGEAQAAALIQKYAIEAGYAFRNEGVTGAVKNAVLNGSPIEKMKDVANQMGIELLIDDDTVIIMPPEKERSGNAVLLSAKSGLVGYPTFTQDGISIKAFYDPSFQLGGLVSVESAVPRASGTWKISKLTHTLEAYKPGAQWLSQIEGVYHG